MTKDDCLTHLKLDRHFLDPSVKDGLEPDEPIHAVWVLNMMPDVWFEQVLWPIVKEQRGWENHEHAEVDLFDSGDAACYEGKVKDFLVAFQKANPVTFITLASDFESDNWATLAAVMDDISNEAGGGRLFDVTPATLHKHIVIFTDDERDMIQHVYTQVRAYKLELSYIVNAVAERLGRPIEDTDDEASFLLEAMQNMRDTRDTLAQITGGG